MTLAKKIGRASESLPNIYILLVHIGLLPSLGFCWLLVSGKPHTCDQKAVAARYIITQPEKAIDLALDQI